MSDQILIDKIDDIVEMLSCPVSISEAADGWTSESKKAVTVFLVELKNKIQSGETLPPMNISRSLDHWGVVGGDILERTAQLSNELRMRLRI